MAPPRMRRIPDALAVALLVAAVSCTSGSSADSLGSPSPATAATTSTAAVCQLAIDTSLSGVRGNQPAAVSGVSAHDVWLVGSHFEVNRSGPLVQHWDGSKWNTVMQGKQAYGSLQLTQVDPIAADDVWAVGFNYGGASSLHWNGSTWAEVKGARGYAGATFLGSAAVSPTEIWAVGKSTVAGGYDAPLVERSNGSTWERVEVPEPAGIAAGLKGVSAAGPGSIWAVGWSVDEHKLFRPLVEHWDGSRWTIRSIPEPSTDALLSGVKAIAPDDVWAVGWSWRSDATRSFIIHWDGTSWSRIELPDGEGQMAKLATVTADGDVVAVAGTAPDADGILQPVAFRLEGTAWTQHAVPVEPSGGGFQGLMLLGGRGMIAAGSQIGAGGYASIVQKGC